MALVACIECGRPISSRALHCIHCGCPMSSSGDKKEANTSLTSPPLHLEMGMSTPSMQDTSRNVTLTTEGQPQKNQQRVSAPVSLMSEFYHEPIEDVPPVRSTRETAPTPSPKKIEAEAIVILIIYMIALGVFVAYYGNPKLPSVAMRIGYYILFAVFLWAIYRAFVARHAPRWFSILAFIGILLSLVLGSSARHELLAPY